MEAMFGILIAVGLAAACGFRVFVPPLVLGVANMLGAIDLAAGMEWVGSPVAVTCFGIATAVEIAAYFIPAVNNVLDVMATPAAVIAGTIVAAGALIDLPPFAQWTLALIAATAVTGPIQLASAAGRATVTATTVGTASPAFSFAESVGSLATAVLAVLLPIVAVVLVILLLGGATWFILRLRRLRRLRMQP